MSSAGASDETALLAHPRHQPASVTIQRFATEPDRLPSIFARKVVAIIDRAGGCYAGAWSADRAGHLVIFFILFDHIQAGQHWRMPIPGSGTLLSFPCRLAILVPNLYSGAVSSARPIWSSLYRWAVFRGALGD